LLKALAYGSSVPEIEPADVAELSIVRIAAEIESDISELAEESAILRAQADTIENEIGNIGDEIISKLMSSSIHQRTTHAGEPPAGASNTGGACEFTS